MGQASIITGLMIVILDWRLGEKSWTGNYIQYVIYRYIYGFIDA